jgi:hypothetical protein
MHRLSSHLSPSPSPSPLPSTTTPSSVAAQQQPHQQQRGPATRRRLPSLRQTVLAAVAAAAFLLAALGVVAGVRLFRTSGRAGAAAFGSHLVGDLSRAQAASLLESRVLARARELDNEVTREALRAFKGIGRYHDRARYWHILARDLVLGRPNAKLTRFGTQAHVVLFATTWFGNQHKWATGALECPAQRPGEPGCVIAFYPDYMRSLAPSADVVLYHRSTGNEEAVFPPPPEARPPGQRHALLSAENFASLFDGDVTRQFDAEMTYRQRSVFRDGGYEIVALSAADAWPRDARTWADIFRRPLVPTAKRRSMAKGDGATVTWAASHCGSRSGREDLIRALGERIPLHIFGTTCLANQKGEEEQYPWPSQSELFRQYKFHLAFENSRCEDYVTEKAFLALARGQVPIYLGAPNIDDFMPARDAYIHAVDFPSAAALAEHLRRLDEDEEAYERYFAWRSRPFSTYGKVLRGMIEEVLPLANRTGPGSPGTSVWFRCSMCYALEKEGATRDKQHESTPPPQVEPFTCLHPIEVAGEEGKIIVPPKDEGRPFEWLRHEGADEEAPDATLRGGGGGGWGGGGGGGDAGVAGAGG